MSTRAQERAERVAARERLRQIRQALKQALAQRTANLKAIKATCRANKREVKARVKAWRTMQALILRRAIDGERARVRTECQREHARVLAESNDVIANARRAIGIERAALSELKRSAKPVSSKRRHAGVKAAIRRIEGDDEVRANIPEDLHGVFNAIRHKIKATSFMSRPEAFMHYVHDHPEVIHEVQNRELEAAIKRLEAEERAEAKRLGMKMPRRRKRKSRVDLSDVPF